MPSLRGRWRRARPRGFLNSMPCSTRRKQRRRRAAWLASTMLALPRPSWRTTRPASSPAKHFTSTAATISSTSWRRREAAIKESAPLSYADWQQRGDFMALKRTAGSNAKEKVKRKAYEKELQKLQVDLCHLQEWVKVEGARIIIVFEGRDAAGKGGTIKAITERVSPRVFRV